MRTTTSNGHACPGCGKRFPHPFGPEAVCAACDRRRRDDALLAAPPPLAGLARRVDVGDRLDVTDK